MKKIVILSNQKVINASNEITMNEISRIQVPFFTVEDEIRFHNDPVYAHESLQETETNGLIVVAQYTPNSYKVKYQKGEPEGITVYNGNDINVFVIDYPYSGEEIDMGRLIEFLDTRKSIEHSLELDELTHPGHLIKTDDSWFVDLTENRYLFGYEIPLTNKAASVIHNLVNYSNGLLTIRYLNNDGWSGVPEEGRVPCFIKVVEPEYEVITKRT